MRGSFPGGQRPALVSTNQLADLVQADAAFLKVAEVYAGAAGFSVPKLVESERADRPVPIVSFVARQRDWRELVGQHIAGAERMSFSDVLSRWKGRFSTISLEDRNLPAIAEKRILKPTTPDAKRKMDEEFARTAASGLELK